MFKQVIVVRKDLGMRKGKMIGQGCHASLSIFKPYLLNNEPLPQLFAEWLNEHQTKIVVSVDSEEELMEIYSKANELSIPKVLIKDLAKTEFKEPTFTAVAIGPDYAEKIDKITGHLKLL